ncbi:hypothetical protein [Paramagnetospirillum kuznetsovii]|uniref:hypothetical protein n=1 Tax=Paramagnetospirillum kuznetsovii TaxID=2053833 RepID=UPI0011BE7EB4|nr:hypothetical protein [Paramagnetospirillum kuznetsovii]
MSLCSDCGDYVPVQEAVRTGLINSVDVFSARNDIRGFNAFCRCEGFVNTCAKEEVGCLCFEGKASRRH